MITPVIKIPYNKVFGKIQTFFFPFSLALPVANGAASGVRNRFVTCLAIILAMFLDLRSP